MTPSEIAEALEARHKYDMFYYTPASPLDRQAAATIREISNEVKKADALARSYASLAGDCVKSMHKTEAKLKIATEALEKITGDIYDEEEASEETIAAIALARIKEVGA